MRAAWDTGRAAVADEPASFPGGSLADVSTLWVSAPGAPWPLTPSRMSAKRWKVQRNRLPVASATTCPLDPVAGGRFESSSGSIAGSRMAISAASEACPCPIQRGSVAPLGEASVLGPCFDASEDALVCDTETHSPTTSVRHSRGPSCIVGRIGKPRFTAGDWETPEGQGKDRGDQAQTWKSLLCTTRSALRERPSRRWAWQAPRELCNAA